MANALNEVMQRLRSHARRHDAVDVSDAELLEGFIVLRDETAFEAIVRRHGPMVLGVCRRILRNDADSEDAFQATFLVLVRKAASIRPRGMVSNWLYGVAHNTALKAKAMIHQRRAKEQEAGTRSKGEREVHVWEQVQSVVDAELSGLPDKYRVPIVLCDLEGKSIKEAMHHLGWPQGTVASRLTRGRALLAKRLSKHGVLMSGGLLAGAFSQAAASASVPAALTATTVQAGCLLAAGKVAAAGGASATAVALANGVVKTMLLVKLKLAATMLVVTTLIVGGIGGIAYKYGAVNKSAEETSAKESMRSDPTRLPETRPNSDTGPVVADKQEKPQERWSDILPGESQVKAASACHPTPDPAKTPVKIYIIHGSNIAAADSVLKLSADAKYSCQERQFTCKIISVRVTAENGLHDGYWYMAPQGQVYLLPSQPVPTNPCSPVSSDAAKGSWRLSLEGKKVLLFSYLKVNPRSVSIHDLLMGTTQNQKSPPEAPTYILVPPSTALPVEPTASGRFLAP